MVDQAQAGECQGAESFVLEKREASRDRQETGEGDNCPTIEEDLGPPNPRPPTLSNRTL